MRTAIVEVHSCTDCPHEDDIGRCGLLDKGDITKCRSLSWGVRDDCPLPKESKKKAILIYNKLNNTVRQEPENYLIARKSGDRWISEPDLAADKGLCVRVYLELFNHSSKYGTGENLIKELNG